MSNRIDTILADIDEDEYLHPKFSSDLNLDILGLFVNSNEYTNAQDRVILDMLTQSEEICSKVRFLKKPCKCISNIVTYDIKRAVNSDRSCAFFIDLPFEFEFEKRFDWYTCLLSTQRTPTHYIQHILENYDELCIYLGDKYDIEEVIKKIAVIRKEIEERLQAAECQHDEQDIES